MAAIEGRDPRAAPPAAVWAPPPVIPQAPPKPQFLPRLTQAIMSPPPAKPEPVQSAPQAPTPPQGPPQTADEIDLDMLLAQINSSLSTIH
jgi:hypothetical protein